MSELRLPAPKGKDNEKIKLAIIGLLACTILAVFLNKGLSVYLGPFMAIAFFYLYFFGYMELVTGIIVVANDALGTIILGKISFPYLLLVMALVRILLRGKIRFSNMVFLFIASIFLMKQYILGFFDLRMVLYSVTFLLSLLTLPRDGDSLKQLFDGVVFAIVLIALHTCITGGVEFREAVRDEIVIRKGVLGVGIGDPNYSCYLLLTGIACLWSDKKLPMWWRVLCSGIILGAMLVTLSTTGLLGLLLMILLAVLVERKVYKTVVFLPVVLFAIVGLFVIYTNLPADMHSPVLDGYIMRMEEKLQFVQDGDLVGATTNRSNIVDKYFRFMLNGSLIKLLFGGYVLNALVTVAHNTYIDMLLQVGITGAVMMLFWIVWKLVLCIRRRGVIMHRKALIMLKALSLFFAFGLSLYQGSLWSLWFYFLMVLS